jgi:hypothetical protein
MPSELYLKLKDFYENSKVAQEVTSPLVEGAVAEVQVEGDTGTYMLIREKGRSWFREGKPPKPQMYMKFTKGAIEWLMDVKNDDVGEYVERMGTCVLDPTPERRIEVKICTNLLTAARMGYFRMMMKGGTRALKLAGKLGIKIPQKFLK